MRTSAKHFGLAIGP